MRLFLYGVLRPIAVVAGVALAVGAAALGVRADPDPLSRPAEPGARAATAVLLGVTRAGEHLVAVGERGVILVSDARGAHWRQVTAPVSVTLTAVSFGTPAAGWAVGHGGVILHSADGGASWVKQLDGVQAAQLELAAARAAAASDAPGAARRLREAERAAQEGADKPFLAVHFWSATEGLVAGAYGALFATTDGGRTWTAARDRLDNPKGKHLYGMHDDGRAIYLAGEQGLLAVSRDRGRSFTPLATPYGGSFFGVTATPALGLVAYGLRGNVLQRASDDADWDRLDTGQSNSITAAAALPDGSVVLADESGRALLRSGGRAGLRALPVNTPFSFTSAALASDGSLVLAGVRGLARVAPDHLNESHRP